jgi:hypothetical protein
VGQQVTVNLTIWREVGRHPDEDRTGVIQAIHSEHQMPDEYEIQFACSEVPLMFYRSDIRAVDQYAWGHP